MLQRLLVFWILPPPLARAYVNVLIFLGLVFKKQLVGPRNIQLSIPSGCDHNCQFCITEIHGQGAPKNRNTLKFDEICRNISSALRLCSLNIHIVSTGEPGLYPKIKDLIDYIHKESRGRAQVKIVTNGTSLSWATPEYVKKRNLHFWISLHSGNYEVWDKIHRPLHSSANKFKSLKEWIALINKSVHDRITLHNVICRSNKDYLESILKFAVETKSKNVFFGRLYKFEELQLNLKEEKEVLEQLKFLKTDFLKNKIKTNIDTFQFVAISQKDESSSLTQKAKPLSTQNLSSQDYYKTNNCYITLLFSPVSDTGDVLSCGAGQNWGSSRSSSYHEVFLQRAPMFLKESSQISHKGTNIEGCRCQSCPHIQMNAIANLYLKKLGF